ncbi:MAG: phenylphosphate carboxylase subunit delta [Wenzhouxiangellaceae bacterium]|nr:phenylphosphate carboxylase subunit delta [Wenzhouxiangellaceae bacterium]
MSDPRFPQELLERAAAIRLAVFDVDGVMTDGRLYRDDAGQEIKAFFSRDGLGLKGLMKHGIEVAVLTARRSKLVQVRMAELGIDLAVQGREDKGAAFLEVLEQAGVEAGAAAYMGDDLVDWPAMSKAALKLAPADAEPWIAERADHVTSARAGRGAVREACELLLAGHGLLDAWRDGFR